MKITCKKCGIKLYLSNNNKITPKKIAIKQDGNGKHYMEFAYPHNSFSFDNKIIIELKNIIFFRVKNKTWVNDEWGISCKNFSELGKALARRFSILSGKAFRNELSQEEKKYWRNIVDDIDYRKYQRETMAPAYLEAKVVKVKPEQITIHIALENRYCHIVGNALNMCRTLEIGDYISIFFRDDGKTEDIDHIEKIDLIPPSSRNKEFNIFNIPVVRI